MTASDVYLMRPEYKEYEKQRFRTNFFNLLHSIRLKQDTADSNNAALMNDSRLRREGGTAVAPRWDGSLAATHLKEDITNGLHDVLSPKELWETRQDYRVFELTKFWKHIYQEVRRRKTSAYWLHKQEEAKQKKKTK